MSDHEVRLLHRLIDARVSAALDRDALELVRGTVTSVGSATLAARLDGADIPTPGIAFMVGTSPAVGDDIVALRRKRDGLLLVLGVLTR
jgi:hypothetical protein